MKYFQSILAVGVILLFAAMAQAKAFYKGKTQMIETAAVIAVVEITSVKESSTQGKHWIYRQEASANVIEVLKGEVPEAVTLYGAENFRCARCHFEVGRYLVFLDRDGELLTGNNWQLSIRKITNDKVEWFAGNEIFSRQEAPLTDVLTEIRSVLSK